MAKSVYVTTTESYIEKSVISLGLMRSLLDQAKKVAFFIPIMDVDSYGKPIDSDVEMILKQFALNIPVKKFYACTYNEAQKLIIEGKSEHLYEIIMKRYEKLMETNDFILCQGTCFSGKNMPAEFMLNANIAEALNIPIVHLINGKGKTFDEVKSALLFSLAVYRMRDQDVACVFINRSFTRDQMASLREGLSIPVYAIPEDSSLSDPDEALAIFDQSVQGEVVAPYLLSYKIKRHTPLQFKNDLLRQARHTRRTIVLPEGTEERILRAVEELEYLDVVDLVLLGNETAIREKIARLKLKIERIRIVDPSSDPNAEIYAAKYAEIRAAKGVTLDQAREKMKDLSYYGTMMVQCGQADGMVSGSITTTANTIRPAFEIVRTKPGISRVSGIYLMCLKNQTVIFADCAVNPNPTPEALAEIAIETAKSAREFGIEPRVAMLSYSTGTSGFGPDVDKIHEAVRIAREMAPELLLDGPMQYDAAVAADVAKTKMPDSPVAGQASVFIFPDLNAGNITCKAVQRNTSAVLIGPILQGLNKPINDLSRGCTVEDIVNTVIVTANQVHEN
ncbi:MAG: phosphate acetyltransferase [Desulfovibrionaceae bacterium]|nr:phosphate acetyltransferase [Desulfovibrionaceae bacterium]